MEIDLNARMHLIDLREKLNACISSRAEEDGTLICGVVAIMGSTEHGSCDQLVKILKIRQEYEEKGLSFVFTVMQRGSLFHNHN